MHILLRSVVFSRLGTGLGRRLLRGIGLVGLLALLPPLAAAAAGPSAPERGPGTTRAGTANDEAFRADGARLTRLTGPDNAVGPSIHEQSAPDKLGSSSPQLREERSWRIWGLNVLVGGLLVVLVLLAVVAPFVVLAVSLVMDGGCLRYGVFAVGWLLSGFGGTAVTLVIGLFATEALGLSSDVFESIALVVISAYFFGYPVAAWWGWRWLQSLPRKRRRAWKQTLTGGALFGFGAGATAGLAPAAGSGFGGFGGGSFGGGGASGSWSASSAGKAAASASGKASSATGTSAGGAGTSVGGAGASGSAGLPATGAAAGATAADGWWDRLQKQWRRFRWYHGVAFVLAGLSFAALGAWVVAALQQKVNPGVVALGSLWAFVGFVLWRWLGPPASRPSGRPSDPEFQGGEASGAWS